MSQPRRVTVVTPHTRVDLALPTQASVAEVVLQIIELVGPAQLDPAGDADGWLLSRLGEQPLDPGRSVGSADVADGDVLHLSPRSATLPPALFDDVVDAIAQVSESRPDRWNVALTRSTSFAGGALLGLLPFAAIVTLSAQTGTFVAIALTIALLLSAAGLSRGAGDATAGLVAGLSAIPYAAWASIDGVHLLQEARLSSTDDFWANTLLVGGSAVALTAVVGALVVGTYREIFGACVASAAMATLAGLSRVVWDAEATTAAALLAGGSMLSLPWLPILSVRLARLPLPI
ncbi:MAG: type VII secretion integral membrane protein EccD, partial [Nocardioides sp.]